MSWSNECWKQKTEYYEWVGLMNVDKQKTEYYEWVGLMNVEK